MVRRHLKRLESSGRRFMTAFISSRISGGTGSVPERIPAGECPRRILLMRWDAIGDMVVCLPFFRELAGLLPAAEIGIVVSRRNLPLLRYERGFTTILWERRPDAFLKSLWSARAFRPDTVVDTRMHYDSTTSFLYALASGAKWSVSASNRSNRLPFSVRVPVPEAGHYADMTARLLSALGPPLDGTDPDRRLRLSSLEREFAFAFWRDAGIRLIGRAVGVNLSARDPLKTWGSANTADLCRLLISMGRTPVLMSAPVDRGEVMTIASSVDGTLAAPESPTILHATAVLEGMAALVTPDTAMVHIAASHGVPVVGLYLRGERHMPTWQPWKIDCELLLAPERGKVSDVTPDDVADAAARMLLRIEGGP